MTQAPLLPTHSPIREELLDVPPVITGDARVDGPLRALLLGEPQRALALLAAGPPDPRAAAALTAWARQLDRNWYPGEVGGEVELAGADAFVEPQADDPPVAYHLAVLARYGPTDLRTPRTLIEMALRSGAAAGVQEALQYADRSLGILGQYAAQTGQQSLAPWLSLMAADLAHRSGSAAADPLLAQARQQATRLQDPPRLALTFLVEGDWYAAPGSSPEALGWDLAPQNVPSPLLAARDLRQAAARWDQADALLQGFDLPRFRSALALRRAWQARLAGVPDTQRGYLRAARELAGRAGDGAAYHLATVHELVADIDDGRLGQHLLQLGGGWHAPEHGPVAELLDWATRAGSRSWCVGLGRLLQRCGDQWAGAGSPAQARVAYLAALALISSDPSVPSRTLQTALSQVDSRLNLSVNALLRLERAFGPAPRAGAGDDDFAFAQGLEAATVMVGALRDRTRGPAAAITADRMQRLRDELEAARAATAARHGTAGEVPRTLEELQAAMAGMRGDGTLPESARAAVDAVALMVRMQLQLAATQVSLLDVLIALTRAEAAQRAGVPAEADRWYAEAAERAARPGADAFLPALVALSAGRKDDAGRLLGERTDQVADDLQFPLWVQIGDVDRAGQTLDRLRAAGSALSDWRSRLSVAELLLARGDAAGARDELLRAGAAFTESVAVLLRDPDRLDACDQPDVAALFSLRARAALDLGDVDDSLAAAEEARALVPRAREAAEDEAGWAEWQRAAAEYAAVANTVLARLATTPTTPTTTDAGFPALDAADRRLAAAEQLLDDRHPGLLLRRAAPLPPRSVRELQQQLPEHVVCLEYLAVGDDLLGWAITRDAIVPSRRPIRYRDLSVTVRSFHEGCSQGRAPGGDELPALLLAPFAEQLRSYPRVVVVPFGALHLVPFHALPFDGAPLGLTHVVSYAASLAAAVGAEGGLDGPVEITRPLVVGDPAFDPALRPRLQPLPGSRLEAECVAGLLGATDPLLGAAATEAAVAARLEDCSVMHISSHGHLDELSPFSSSLVMAGADELTVAELVGLRFGTSLAVLTGCDTGRGNATLGGDVVGLTRSLLRGGVRRVVVSLWPVDDWVAPVVMQRFYGGLQRGLPAAQALAEAQRAVQGLDAEALRAAYVALGGTAGDGRRRGVALDPELRDEEELPAPLGGDAERFWAPFIVVG